MNNYQEFARLATFVKSWVSLRARASYLPRLRSHTLLFDSFMTIVSRSVAMASTVTHARVVIMFDDAVELFNTFFICSDASHGVRGHYKRTQHTIHALQRACRRYERCMQQTCTGQRSPRTHTRTNTLHAYCILNGENVSWNRASTFIHTCIRATCVSFLLCRVIPQTCTFRSTPATFSMATETITHSLQRSQQQHKIH